MIRGEVVTNLAKEADGEECGANEYMESVEAGGYEECGTVDPVCNCKGGFMVFYSLEECKVAP